MGARTSGSRRSGLRTLALTSLAIVVAFGCAEIEKTTPEAAEQLGELRADLEYINLLVAYQKKRKAEVTANGGNPNRLDEAVALAGEARFKRLWIKQREIEIDKFEHRYLDLSADIIKQCIVKANHESVQAYEIDKCTDQLPSANYDPIKTAGVTFGVVLLFFLAMGLYRSGRRRLDPVALSSKELGLEVKQGRRSTEMTGQYKGRDLRIESSAPEAGRGDKYIRVHVLSGVDGDVVVRFGPLAPPTGLELPDLEAPEVADGRLPDGYKLRLSEGASAEELLSGDVGFQIREFDPVDVRVHDGVCVTTTWFLVSEPAQVVEFVDLCLAVAEQYKQA